MVTVPHYLGASGRCYEIQDRLSSGGFGTVYKAICLHDGSAVALKTLTGPTLAAAALEQEAGALQSVSDKHVVAYLDHGSTPEPFLAMEFADGGTLADRLHQANVAAQPVAVAHAISWLEQTASGLAAIHAAGLIHRDLKPLNLLFSVDDLKVADFGIARIADASTASGTFRGWGSLTYMPPEGWQEDGGPRPSTRLRPLLASVLAHESVAGQPPFVGDRDALRRGHCFQPPPSLISIRPDVPAPLVTLILTLLAKDPARRPQTAGEVLGMFRRLDVGAGSDSRTDAADQPGPVSARSEEIRQQAARMAARLSEQEARQRLGEERERQEAELLDGALGNLDRLVEEALVSFRAAVAPHEVQAQGQRGAWAVRVAHSPRVFEMRVQPASFEGQNAPGRIVLVGYLHVRQDNDVLGGANIVGHVKHGTPWIVEFQEIQLRNNALVRHPMREYEPFYLHDGELIDHGLWLWGGALHVFQPAVGELRFDVLLDWFGDLVV